MTTNIRLNQSLQLVLKKHYFILYQKAKRTLKNNNQQINKINKIKKYIYKLYISTLTNEDLEQLKKLNSYLKYFADKIECEIYSNLNETNISQDSINDSNQFIIILRDLEGFYSSNKYFQNYIDKNRVMFDELHKILLEKEAIMNGNRKKRNNNLSRKEISILSRYLGYGYERTNLLISQNRYEKEKRKIKNKY